MPSIYKPEGWNFHSFSNELMIMDIEHIFKFYLPLEFEQCCIFPSSVYFCTMGIYGIHPERDIN